MGGKLRDTIAIFSEEVTATLPLPKTAPPASVEALPAVLSHHLAAAKVEPKAGGVVLKVASTYQAQALRRAQAQVEASLGATILDIEVCRTDVETKPQVSLQVAQMVPKTLPPHQASLALPPRLSAQSSAEAERSRRLPVPSMVISPVLQPIHDLAKRWTADSTQVHSPKTLWVSGKSGSGKTLLLRQMHSWVPLSRRITTVSAMNFFYEWRRSIESKDPIPFKRKYRKETDLLILEDIDALETRPKTQEELLFVVNALLERGAAIAVSSTKQPILLKQFLNENLFSRLYGGMTLEMPEPDREFRERMFRLLMEQQGLKNWPVDLVVQEKLFSIPLNSAQRVQSLMSNAIAILSLRQSLTLQDISDLEVKFLPQSGPRSLSMPSPQELVEKVSRLCGLGPSAIQGNGRRAEVALARRFVCLALSRFLGLTNASIAVFVHKDASTVSKALVVAEEEISQSRHVAGQWAYVCSQLGIPT